MSSPSSAGGAAAISIVLILAACGAGDNTSAIDESSAGEPSTMSTAQSATPSTTTPPASSRPETTTTTTTGTTPTQPPSGAIALDLGELPTLVADVVDAVAGDEDVYVVASEFFGFGFPIEPPNGSTLHRASATMSNVDELDRWSLAYSVVTADGAIEDIDIDIDGYGPGSIAVTDRYDPIMTELDFSRNGATASDPGDKGGPNSVNHVYIPAEEDQIVNGVSGRLPNIKIWAAEDIVGGSYSDNIEILAGYRYTYDFETAAGAASPVPLIEALLGEVPVPGVATLDEVRLDMAHRSDDSFDRELGTTYVSIRISWALPNGTFDDAVSFLADPGVFDTSSVLIAAGQNFFDEGSYEPAVLEERYRGRQDLAVLLLERYEGMLTIWPADDSSDEKLELSMELNPNAAVLEPPTS